jgi:hypothetical protein
MAASQIYAFSIPDLGRNSLEHSTRQIVVMFLEPMFLEPMFLEPKFRVSLHGPRIVIDCNEPEWTQVAKPPDGDRR